MAVVFATMEKEEIKGKERRQYFRLKYQVVDRPSIVIEGEASDVVDLSERGLRFAYSGGIVENPVRAKIVFQSGMEVEIEGAITRISEGEICLNVPSGIPLRVLMDEQRRLYTKYGVVMEGDEY